MLKGSEDFGDDLEDDRIVDGWDRDDKNTNNLQPASSPIPIVSSININQQNNCHHSTNSNCYPTPESVSRNPLFMQDNITKTHFHSNNQPYHQEQQIYQSLSHSPSPREDIINPNSIEFPAYGSQQNMQTLSTYFSESPQSYYSTSPSPPQTINSSSIFSASIRSLSPNSCTGSSPQPVPQTRNLIVQTPTKQQHRHSLLRKSSTHFDPFAENSSSASTTMSVSPLSFSPSSSFQIHKSTASSYSTAAPTPRRVSRQDIVRALIERRKAVLKPGGATATSVSTSSTTAGPTAATVSTKTARARENRLRAFFKRGLWRHDQSVWRNRGVFLPEDESKWNLGMLLHITDKFNPDLDIDSDQSVLDSTSMVVLSLVTASGVSSNIGVFSIQSEEAATSLELSPFFNAADELVKSQMAKKNVVADLDKVLDAGFSVDIALDLATGQVLGAVEYVMMKKYVWIDAVAVLEAAQGNGIGSIFLKRLMSFAAARDKQVLCFSLNDVVPFYIRHGFRLCPELFPEKPWHIGKFLVADCRFIR